MSLIADALHAAQEERARDTGGELLARRMLAGTPARGGAARLARGRTPLPATLRLASAVFGVSLLAAGGFVALAPRAARPPARPAAPAPPPPSAPAPAPTPREEAGAPDVPPLEADVPDDSPPPVDAGTPPPPAEMPIEQPAPAAPAAGDAERPAPGRFQLTVDPAPAPADGALFEQAVAAQNRRDFSSAATLYRRIVQTEPSNAPAWSNLGVALGALGEDTEARAALAEAIRLDPANPGARVNLAVHYQRRGLAAEARRLLDEVLRTDPSVPEAHYALARLLEQERDLAGAVRHYQLFLGTGAGRFPQLEGLVRQRVEQLRGGGQ